MKICGEIFDSSRSFVVIEHEYFHLRSEKLNQLEVHAVAMIMRNV